MDLKNLNEVPAFITKDGSEIRELLAHRNHPRAEEIYFITHGQGRIRIGDEVREVGVGDAVGIARGLRHKLWNTGPEPLRLLCCCVPGYEHNDTVLTEM